MSAVQRIAVLGGGPAALSAAFHLTSVPDWRERYEITVYQMGWRLGGKCASSRNENASQRIAEHGIHLFGNFYSNTFHMLKDCYEAVQWRSEEPIQTIDQAFIGDNYALLTDYHNGRWHAYDSWLPHNQEKPWSGEGFAPSPRALVEELLGVVYGLLRNKPLPQHSESDASSARGWLQKLSAELALDLEKAGEHLAERLLRGATSLAEKYREDPKALQQSGMLAGLEHLLSWLKNHADAVAERDGYWRWLYLQVDFYTTIARGVLADDLLGKDVDIDSVDNEDYRDWLRRHGASEPLLRSALPQNIINVCFHYPQGNSFALPSMSAAAYLTFILRQVTAKGSGAYFFAAGTGETIIMPLYRALRQRGVKFKFFHKVTAIEPGERQIDSFSCDVQATLAEGVDEYRPLVSFKDLDGWPAEPLYDQLKEGERLQAEHADLESYWASWQPVEQQTFRAGEDFDLVLLGLSIGAFEHVCPKLLAAPRWRQMVDKLPAIQTQMYQLWLNKSLPELGWDPEQHDLQPGDRLICGNYNFPATDAGDFSDLLRWEGWPDDNQPRSILYFCGPLEELDQTAPFSDHDYPSRQYERVKWTAVQYMRTLNGLLPSPGSSPIDAQTLDPNFLVCPGEPAQPVNGGVNRLARQFFRANIDPTERYVLSVPGGAAARLAPWQSGYSNLVLCGDWTYNGVNVGSVEAAVTSGMLASLAIAGAPTIDNILGYTFMHPDAPRPGEPLIPPAD